MKKLLCIFAASLISLPAFSAYHGPSSGDEVMTVKQLLAYGRDDQYVTLRGYITKQLRHEHYLFSDETGTVQVDIDTHHMPAEIITDKTKVEITGEYDKEYDGTSEIEVKKVIILKP